LQDNRQTRKGVERLRLQCARVANNRRRMTLAEIVEKENALREELIRLRELRKQLEAQIQMTYKNQNNMTYFYKIGDNVVQSDMPAACCEYSANGEFRSVVFADDAFVTVVGKS